MEKIQVRPAQFEFSIILKQRIGVTGFSSYIKKTATQLSAIQLMKVKKKSSY